MRFFKIKVSQNFYFFGEIAMYGYAGKLLRANLSNKSVKEEPLRLDYLEKYLGGIGIATRILYDEVGLQVRPLDPENRLIFMTGPFTGTKAPCTGKHVVVSKNLPCVPCRQKGCQNTEVSRCLKELSISEIMAKVDSHIAEMGVVSE